MPYTLIIWDFDGTLADTLPVWLQVYNQVAEQRGFRQIDDPQSLRDLPMRAVLRSLGIRLWQVPRLIREVVAGQEKLMGTISLYPGVLEVLASCKAKGISQGIASTNTVHNIQTCLAANRAEQYFDFIEGSSRLFGKQRALRRVVRQRRVDPSQVLYLGDEVRDVLAAGKAGIDVAAVTWGLNSEEALRRTAPTHLIREPDELEPILVTRRNRVV